ncbi:MAG: DUF2442 domain-containing protein [Balneola sp.]|nr:DUF2442 domain-containing protein [Balneola sp.]
MITSTKHKTEVTNISSHGIWLFYERKEYFLPYSEFPWFKDAKVQHILNVETPSENHFFWPDLDIDLSLDSINNPGKYPLVAS